MARSARRRRLPGNAVNLAEGVNGVLMAALADGQPHRYKDLKRIVADAGIRHKVGPVQSFN